MAAQALVDHHLGAFEVHGEHALAGPVQVLHGARVVPHVRASETGGNWKGKIVTQIENTKSYIIMPI